MKYTVKVKAGSSREEVFEASENELIIATHARAHDGEANAKVIELLANYFGTAKSNVKILRGEKSKIKIIEIS